uniref:Uncharacterized protein n=1 Tax=Avena sativa TaxID=4498 RepID=A0ACD5WR01_AVESA
MAPLLKRVLLLVVVAVAAGTASSSSTTTHARFDPTRAVHVSWRPRAFVYKGFLSEAECDHLVALAKEGRLVKATAVDRESGKTVASEVRTSSGMFLPKKQDAVVARIEERIAAWTLLPQENGEAMQILRYESGQRYEPHVDYIIRGRGHRSRGGHRVATVIMYLSDVEMGGETVFPNADQGELVMPKDNTLSECARRGYAVKPVKGDAVLFFSLHPNATTDPDSLHGSCPVIQGEKWSATKWIHVRSFDDLPVQSGCDDDEDALCP